ncbi:MAG: PAS domain S-box protein [Bacteroidetes bacterium]|nr:PAS domain S-box protein [Bacteroidota bacterium]HET6243452.1 PAS domain S-box protein [Bacteroidia bacterium]
MELKDIALVLIGLGFFALIISGLKTHAILHILNKSNKELKIWKILNLFILLFAVGYIVYVFFVFSGNIEQRIFITGILYFTIALFVNLVVWVNTRTISDLIKKDKAKQQIQDELESKIKISKENEEKIQIIFQNAPDAVIVINEQGKIIKWNPKAEILFGWTEKEVMNKTLSETIIPERYREAHNRGLKHFFKTGEGPVLHKTIEIEAINRQNKEFDVALSISPSKIKDKYIFIGFIRDITEQKKVEKQLMESEKIVRQNFAFTNSILENIPNMVFVKDANKLRFVSLNKAGEELLGYSKEYLIGKNDYDFFSKEQADYFSAKDKEVLSQNEVYEILEEPIITKYKGKRWLHTKKIALMDDNGNPAYLMGISDDITERKMAEQTIRQNSEELEKNIKLMENANKELEAFSYSVSHDLRAPIRGINAFTRIIQEKYKDKFDEEGKELLQIIVDEAVRMGKLIDDLLAFSRLGRKDLEKSNVDMTALAKEALDEILKLSQGKYTAKITVKDLALARCDSTLIRQVWINLITNALKYSFPKPNPVIEIGSYRKDEETVYYIKDNGVGFDMKYYGKLFGVFQRLHSQEEFEGTGIGLAIVKKIISRHGGKVWAEGELHKGAGFYFSLPD